MPPDRYVSVQGISPAAARQRHRPSRTKRAGRPTHGGAALSVLSARDFWLLWLSQTASVIGDALVLVAVGLLVTRLTGDPLCAVPGQRLDLRR